MRDYLQLLIISTLTNKNIYTLFQAIGSRECCQVCQGKLKIKIIKNVCFINNFFFNHEIFASINDNRTVERSINTNTHLQGLCSLFHIEKLIFFSVVCGRQLSSHDHGDLLQQNPASCHPVEVSSDHCSMVFSSQWLTPSRCHLVKVHCD